ncbi:hypothetical protein BKA70DRAFT_536283 [Coprinopsis sp. MPI-PUGE-AT-0042]|nr:hypothetical protein BKA70DRAFT_536283 [Coprinopsis sp. MPI-PUGE-AT-0042]
MKFSKDFQVTSTVASPEDLEVTKEMITSLITACEKRDLSLVHKFYHDEDASLHLAGDVATGFGPITQFYKWMFSATSEDTYEIKTLDIRAKETIATIEGWLSFPKGTPINVFLTYMFKREPGDHKFTELTVSGDDLDMLAERWVLNAGPPPSCVVVDAMSIN